VHGGSLLIGLQSIGEPGRGIRTIWHGERVRGVAPSPGRDIPNFITAFQVVKIEDKGMTAAY